MIDPLTATFIMTMVLPGIIGKCVDVATNTAMDEWRQSAAVGNAINEFLKALPDERDCRKDLDRKLEEWCKSTEFVESQQDPARQFTTVQAATDSFRRITNITDSPCESSDLETLIGEFLVELSIQLGLVDPRYRAIEERKRFASLQEATYATHKNTEEIKETQVILVSQLDELLRSQKSPARAFSFEAQDDEQRDSSELAFHSQIDTAVQHIKREHVLKAKDILLRVREEVRCQPKASQYLMSRLACNLGVCFLRLGQIENAKLEHGAALDHRRSRLNYSNLAAAHLVCQEHQNALMYSNLAMEFRPKNSRSLAIHLQILAACGLHDDVRNLASDNQEVCNSSSDCLLALGRIAYDAGDFNSARNLFSQAAEKAPYDPHLPMMIASALFKLVDDAIANQGQTPLDGKQPEPIEQDLLEIERLTTQSTELGRDADYEWDQNRTLDLRIAARFLLQKYAEAEQDCEQLLRIEPNHQLALVKLAHLKILLHNDKETAIKLFAKVDPSNLGLIAVIAAGVYIDLDDVPKARCSLGNLKTIIVDRKLWYVYAYESLRLAQKENRLEDSIAELQEEFPDNGDVLYAIAEKREEQNRITDALDLLLKAESASKVTLRPHILQLKARAYLKTKCWRQAADALESFARLDENNDECFNYIVALANAQQLHVAGVRAKEARERNNNIPMPVITEIESAFHESCGDFVTARDLLIQLSETNPSAQIEWNIRRLDKLT